MFSCHICCVQAIMHNITCIEILNVLKYPQTQYIKYPVNINIDNKVELMCKMDCYLYFLIDVIIRWLSKSDYNNFQWLRNSRLLCPFARNFADNVCIYVCSVCSSLCNDIYELLEAMVGCGVQTARWIDQKAKCIKLQTLIQFSIAFACNLSFFLCVNKKERRIFSTLSDHDNDKNE